MKVCIATDSAIKGGINDLQVELDFGTQSPFGYIILPWKPFIIVSKSKGIINFYETVESGLRKLKEICRKSLNGEATLDVRLFEWNNEIKVWKIHTTRVNFYDC